MHFHSPISESESKSLHGLRMSLAFMDRNWRKQPCVLRGIAKDLSKLKAWAPEFGDFCVAPAKARLFQNSADGTSIAADIADTRSAFLLFEEYASNDEMLTLLLNNVEQVCRLMSVLHMAFGVNRDWRKGDVVATLSTVGSGIG